MEGGLIGTFIDWRGYPTVHAAAEACDLEPLNLVVWSKTNAGMGSLYRSGHELLPLYKKGDAPHVNNVELGRHGRWRSNVWTYPGASSLGSDARRGLQDHPTVKPTAMLEDAILDLTGRGNVFPAVSVPVASAVMLSELEVFTFGPPPIFGVHDYMSRGGILIHFMSMPASITTTDNCS